MPDSPISRLSYNEYWLCGCKHTNKPPFCDGIHKTLKD
ncbi:MAG: hypothetical protein GXP13_00690 [Gammaproteobacteria bacterium]|nr:hypothetical protein [Gammaproteobacteria bacterium]